MKEFRYIGIVIVGFSGEGGNLVGIPSMSFKETFALRIVDVGEGVKRVRRSDNVSPGFVPQVENKFSTQNGI